MTKEELKQEAEEYAEGMAMYYESAHGSIPSQFEKYLRNAYISSAEPREKRIAELETQIEKMKCCENCGWYYLQQHWRESKEINESRMFHCGTCGNKKNWKLKEIKEK